MKVLLINTVCGIKSTGRICSDLARELSQRGHTVVIAYGREEVPSSYRQFAYQIGNNTDTKLHGLRARLFDGVGTGSKTVTKHFVEWIKKYDPDIIHLHNLHGYYINSDILFDYLKNCEKKIIWTFHDCWPFTGHCTYFDYVQCDKWKTGCSKCPQLAEYPKSWFDNSKTNWIRKCSTFVKIPNMTIVTPSEWMADIVKQSFLREYEVEVIHNGIDTLLFKETESDLIERYDLHGKKVVLGVAATWIRRKGLDCMIQLSELLGDEYKVVVVGISEQQKLSLPASMIGIMKTSSIEELASWYTIAYVYANPTREDNYPTTNLEAISCGTPVVTFDTGGSGESAKLYGSVVPKEDVREMVKVIKAGNFINSHADVSKNKMIQSYLDLYGI